VMMKERGERDNNNKSDPHQSISLEGRGGEGK
jgi:hypothetical protein